MSRDDHQMRIRLPADVKDGLDALSTANKRSINAEINAAVEYWLHIGSAKAPSLTAEELEARNDAGLTDRLAEMRSLVKRFDRFMTILQENGLLSYQADAQVPEVKKIMTKAMAKATKETAS